VLVAVERGRDDLLGGGDRQVGELLAQLGDGGVAFELDLVTSASERGVGIGLGLAAGVGLDADRDLLRLRDEVLRIAAAGLDLVLDLALGLGDWAFARSAALSSRMRSLHYRASSSAGPGDGTGTTRRMVKFTSCATSTGRLMPRSAIQRMIMFVSDGRRTEPRT
jgi:hypothetical protein